MAASTPDDEIASAVVARPGEGLEARLERIAATFATETPDFEGLVRLWDELARESEVVPGSIRAGPPLRGELALGGGALRASFTLEDDLCRVELQAPATGDERLPLVLRSTALAFQHADGSARAGRASVQFHPDTGRPAATVLAAGEERLIGWSLRQDGSGAIGKPITTRLADDGRSWTVGASTTRQPIPATSCPDGRAEHALLAAIRRAVR